MAYLSVERRIAAIEKARALISDPQHLSRGAMWRDGAGNAVNWPEQAVSYSIMGATAAILPNLTMVIEVDVELLETVIEYEWYGASDLEAFSDNAPHRLVMLCFDLTVERLREQIWEPQLQLQEIGQWNTARQ